MAAHHALQQTLAVECTDTSTAPTFSMSGLVTAPSACELFVHVNSRRGVCGGPGSRKGSRRSSC
eukprot:4606396-Amphidinium_carterae.1